MISRMLVIDDDPRSRQGFSYPIEDLGIKPVLEEGPITDLQEFVARVSDRAQAVLCDYRLKQSGAYSSFDEDELAAECYRHRIPALLCTQFTDEVDKMSRRLRRFVPSLIKTNSPDPDEIRRSLDRCQRELDGDFHPTRRPWRTLVRVHDVVEDGGYCHVIVPAWNPNQAIRLYESDIGPSLKSLKPDDRLHAKVNIGADGFDDLYFVEWEP